MLPYSSSGAYGYGRRKGYFTSPSTIAAALTVVLLAALGFAAYTHIRASALLSAKVALQRDLDSTRSELYSLKSQFSSRNADLEQLQATHGHTQRRLSEVNSQLQRKEAELAGKEQLLQQQVKERTVAEQHRSARETELTKMVEDLRQELVRTDGIIEALDKKVGTMEEVHSQREKDWHKLAATWVKYEQDLHEQYKKCTDEVSNLRNQTTKMNISAPLPEAEPQLRPETDFGHINVVVPEHKAHTFDPLAPQPSPAPVPAATTTTATELPLPESKIRDSIVKMTGGQVGLEPGQTLPPSPAPAPATGTADAQHTAPTPTQAHHQDIYHHDFHDEFHDHYTGHYDQYHGHYESYDPMDQYWMRDAHGDWNADSGDHHVGSGGSDDTAHHHHIDQHANHHNQHHQHDQYANYHNQHNQHDTHANHKNSNDLHDKDQHRYNYQEQHNQHAAHAQHAANAQHAIYGGGVEQHTYHHQQVPAPMAGMGVDPHQAHHPQQQQPQQQPQPGHAQHAPSRWHHDQHQQHHDQQQQQYQQHQEYHQYQQQQYQQHQEYHQQHHQQQPAQQQQQQHHHHPQGDLAYKMGF